MSKSNLLNIIISGLLTLSIGLFTGYIIAWEEAKKTSFPELKQIPDLNPGIATIKFLKQEEGKIYGKVEGQKARIAYSPENIEDLEVGETFEIPLDKISLSAYYRAEDIPEGVAYISSKTGKYAYSILDPRSLRILPKNRIYFATKEEAYEAGFITPE